MSVIEVRVTPKRTTQRSTASSTRSSSGAGRGGSRSCQRPAASSPPGSTVIDSTVNLALLLEVSLQFGQQVYRSSRPWGGRHGRGQPSEHAQGRRRGGTRRARPPAHGPVGMEHEQVGGG